MSLLPFPAGAELEPHADLQQTEGECGHGPVVSTLYDPELELRIVESWVKEFKALMQMH